MAAEVTPAASRLPDTLTGKEVRAVAVTVTWVLALGATMPTSIVSAKRLL